MIVFCFCVLAVVAGVSAGYAGSTSGNDLGHGGSGDSYGYGYSGSFSGNGPQPNFEFPAFDFAGVFGNYFDSLSRHHNEFIRKGGGALSYSYAASSPAAKATAKSSLTFTNRPSLQENIGGGHGQAEGFSGGYGGSFGTGDNAYGGSFSGPSYSYASPNTGPRVYPERANFFTRGSFGEPVSGGASSSASVGPQGVHQTASVYPENPNSPNINTRFAAAPSGGGGGGFRSVFTASESHTNNVDGRPVTVQKATTTVNDNGKITTYVAKNPQ